MKRTAIITGGSRGIGRGIAEELADMGYDLLLVAKDSARLKKAAYQISANKKVNVDYFVCDIANAKKVDALYDFCVSKRIIPDLLVNNAGIFIQGTTGNAPLEKYDSIMAVNTRGMFHLTQKLLPLIKKGHDQRVIIISSTWALESSSPEGREDSTIYSISKWALRGWARHLRTELRKYNIGVTIIYPGAVFTDEWKGTRTPRSKFIEPSDIGKVVRAVVSTNSKSVIEEVIIRPIGG